MNISFIIWMTHVSKAEKIKSIVKLKRFLSFAINFYVEYVTVF